MGELLAKRLFSYPRQMGLSPDPTLPQLQVLSNLCSALPGPLSDRSSALANVGNWLNWVTDGGYFILMLQQASGRGGGGGGWGMVCTAFVTFLP